MIIRGLRAVSDFEYEFQMVAMNQRLNTEIETVFLMADPRHQAIASRLVKEIALLGGDVSAFTTPADRRSFGQTMQGTEIMARDPENTLILELKSGPVVIALRPDLAPNHVARIKELTRKGFYDGVSFHRVIPGFMAQTGDPTGTGSGGSDLPDLKAEFSSAEAQARHRLGGPHRQSQQRQQPVLHLLRRRALARPAIFGLGRSGRRHGPCRRHQEGRRAQQWRHHRRARSGAQGADRVRRLTKRPIQPVESG